MDLWRCPHAGKSVRAIQTLPPADICHQQTSGPSPFFAAKGPLTTPVFQEELVRSESGQRASSITDSM
jgi:hypothetical protein